MNVGETYLSKAAYRIKGANGSGKSTFLKALAGLTPFKGDVWLNKKNLFKEKSCRLQELLFYV